MNTPKTATAQLDKHSETPPETTPLSGRQLRYMTAHSACAMCDTKLEIRHEINKNDLKIKEEAHCPSCGIRVRSAHHLLH